MSRKATAWDVKFDLIFAFSYMLDEHDTWIHDIQPGWGAEIFLAHLAGLWRPLLQHSNEQVCIKSV